MGQILIFINVLVSIYSMVIIVRIILSWFAGSVRIPDFILKITDPYLDWFRQFRFLRIGYLDLSPIAALGVLSVLSRVLVTLAHYGTIRLGIVLAMVLQIVWSAASFFFIFLIIILILRLIGYLTNQNIYGVFWRMVDTISQPVLYRIKRIIFRKSIVNYLTGIIVSTVVLIAVYFILRKAVELSVLFLVNLPV